MNKTKKMEEPGRTYNLTDLDTLNVRKKATMPVENVDDETNPGDIAIQIINTLPKHEKLINFWPLWEKDINDIK